MLDMSFKLPIVPTGLGRNEWQQTLNRHVALTENSLVNEAQDANVPSKRSRSEVEI